MSLPQLDDYAEQVISPALSTLDGVGEVQVFGARRFAVRAEVDPAALNALGIGIDQVTSAVGNANSITPSAPSRGRTERFPSRPTPPSPRPTSSTRSSSPRRTASRVQLGDVACRADSITNTQSATSTTASRRWSSPSSASPMPTR